MEVNNINSFCFLEVEAEKEKKNYLKKKRAVLRSDKHYFGMSDSRFIELFRVTKEMAHEIISDLENILIQGRTNANRGMYLVIISIQLVRAYSLLFYIYFRSFCNFKGFNCVKILCFWWISVECWARFCNKS